MPERVSPEFRVLFDELEPGGRETAILTPPAGFLTFEPGDCFSFWPFPVVERGETIDLKFRGAERVALVRINSGETRLPRREVVGALKVTNWRKHHV